MNVSDRQKAYIQINEDAESVFSVIEEFAGVLPFDDHASPEVIKREFGPDQTRSGTFREKCRAGRIWSPVFYDKENKFGVYTFTCPYRIQPSGWLQ